MAVYIGIDWSEKKHDVVCMNEKGAVITQFQIAHSADGFVQLDSKLRKLGVTPENILIGLETAHNLLIDFLWDKGYSQVYVIPPNMTRSCQGRYRQSGARNDASDAHLIADLLRTDRHRLYPWHPDSCLTLELRAKVHWFMSLSRSKRRLESQLRAILLRYYPAALQVFGELDSQITLEFIQTYPTPQAATQLTLAEFKNFVRQHRFPIGKIPGCFERLQAKQPEAARHTVLAYQQQAVQLATLLLQTVRTLAAVPEGDGTLLDNCLVYACSDSQFARIHELNGIPLITAGRSVKPGAAATMPNTLPQPATRSSEPSSACRLASIASPTSLALACACCGVTCAPAC